MSDVRAIAAAYRVRVELADLGDWGTVRLISEYDPEEPVIRINVRGLRRILRHTRDDMPFDGAREPARSWIDRAIAHELYHHREAIGEIPVVAGRAAREAAADAFADELVRSPVRGRR